MLAQFAKTTALMALLAAPAAAHAGGYGYDRFGGGYQASGYQSQSYSASTRIEEEAHGVTGVIGRDGRAHVTGSYHGGQAYGGGYGQETYGAPPHPGGGPDIGLQHAQGFGGPGPMGHSYGGQGYVDRQAYGGASYAEQRYSAQGIGGSHYDGPTYAPPPPVHVIAPQPVGYGHDCGSCGATPVYAPPPPVCPPGVAHGGERVLRCVFVPRQREVRLNDSFFYGGGGVGPDYIAGGGGGGGMVVIGGGHASAGARASGYASASASASASARVSISGGYRGGGKGKGGGCNSCGGKGH